MVWYHMNLDTSYDAIRHSQELRLYIFLEGQMKSFEHRKEKNLT